MRLPTQGRQDRTGQPGDDCRESPAGIGQLGQNSQKGGQNRQPEQVNQNGTIRSDKQKITCRAGQPGHGSSAGP